MKNKLVDFFKIGKSLNLNINSIVKVKNANKIC